MNPVYDSLVQMYPWIEVHMFEAEVRADLDRLPVKETE